MRLSTFEARIIESIYLSSELSIPSLSKRLRSSSHRVRYALKRLCEKKILRPGGAINVYPLGLFNYGVLLSLSASGSNCYDRVIEYLQRHNRVTFLAEVGGSYNIATTVCVCGIKEVYLFLDELSSQFGRIFSEKAVVAHCYYHDFTPLLISSKRSSEQVLSWGFSPLGPALDSLDKKILRGLCRSDFTSRSKLAQEVGERAQTIDYRVKNLKTAGIFLGRRYYIDAQALGFKNYLILLSVKDLCANNRKKIVQYCVQQKTFIYVIETIGNWDFEIGVHAVTTKDVVANIQMLTAFLGPNLDSIKSLPVFEYNKVSDFPFAQ